MFRRREDSLFDEGTDTATTETTEAAASSQASSTSSGAQAAAPTPPGQVASRFTPESRTNTGGAFRSSVASPLPSDISRNRMPDVKPAAASSSSATTSVDKNGKTIRRVLTVGSDILLKGEIATCDRLVIEGKVDATLNDVHTVEIAETGSFKGSAHIEEAEINGLFEGDLIVRGRLVIYANGRVRGKITYGEIEIERGGELSGEIKSSSNQSAGANTRVRAKDSVAA